MKIKEAKTYLTLYLNAWRRIY